MMMSKASWMFQLAGDPRGIARELAKGARDLAMRR
jgi:hypothetical protein